MVQLVVNGTKVETQADPGMPLLWFLMAPVPAPTPSPGSP